MTAIFKSQRTYKRRSVVSQMKRLEKLRRIAAGVRPKNFIEALELEWNEGAKKVWRTLHPTKGIRTRQLAYAWGGH